MTSVVDNILHNVSSYISVIDDTVAVLLVAGAQLKEVLERNCSKCRVGVVKGHLVLIIVDSIMNMIELD